MVGAGMGGRMAGNRKVNQNKGTDNVGWNFVFQWCLKLSIFLTDLHISAYS